MKVDANLLAKYHRNQCTPFERATVEDWLLNDSVDELAFHSEADKLLIKDDVWASINADLPQEEPLVRPLKSACYYMWKGAVAATLVIGLVAVALFAMQNKDKEVEFVAFNNPSTLKVNHVNSSEYSLSIGPETFADIDESSGVINLTGSILISPKRDITLKFDGAAQDINLKKGQTYIILNSKLGTHGLIVINEKNLINLPPVIQKKLIREFDI